MSNINIFLIGLYVVNCTGGLIIKSTLEDFNLNNPNSGYLMGPATADPAATILNVGSGGFSINETTFPNRAFFGKLIPPGGQNLVQALSYPDVTCTITKNTTSPFSLVNAAGEEVSYPIYVKKRDPQCNSEGAKAVVKFIKDISAYASSIQDSNQISQLINSFDVLAAKESMQGCSRLIGSYLSFKNATVSVANSNDCPFRREDPRWSASPCCNPNIRDQCCAKQAVEKTVLVVDSVNSTLLSNSCQNPDKIAALVNLAASSYNYGFTKSNNDPKTIFDTYTSFIQTCQTAVFQTSCTSDSDCVYGGSCGQNSICSVDYSNPAPALFSCFLANAKSDLITEVKSILGVPTFNNTGDQAAALAQAVNVPSFSTSTCVGRNGFNFNGKPTATKDDKGNFVPGFSAADAVGCVSEYECSYEPWKRLTNTSCLGDALQGYCGSCDASGRNCNPVFGAKPATCALNTPNNDGGFSLATECGPSGYNGRLATYGPSQYCILDRFNTSAAACSNAAPVTSAGPKPGNVTCDSQRTDMNRCSDFLCYGNETQQSCTPSQGLFKQWFLSDAGGVCRYPGKTISSCRSTPNAFVAIGTIYQPGVFSTPQTCPSLTCNRNGEYSDFDASNSVSFSFLLAFINMKCILDPMCQCPILHSALWTLPT